MGMARGHTITITPAELHVEVAVDGETIAESDRPVLLEETGLPTRYYLRREDIRAHLVGPTGTTSTCPFTGDASYWSVHVDGREYEDVAWSYEDPIPGGEGIAGLVCFYPERVELKVG
jgi:uncharacterized protein (DUF427 family)